MEEMNIYKINEDNDSNGFKIWAVHKVYHAPRGGVWESVTVCDRGGGKDRVMSHFQFFHNLQFILF